MSTGPDLVLRGGSGRLGTPVGDRLRKLRVAQGLSQLRLAEGLPISPSYISLIETGQRMPSRSVAEALSTRLGCTADYLLTGRGGPESGDLDLELRFAELALCNGEVEAARERFERVLAHARESGHHHEETEALWGLARAARRLGDGEQAADTLLALLEIEDLSPAVSRPRICASLAHLYIEWGDLARAATLCEAALAGYRGGGNDVVHPDEVLRLASTLVWCYYEQGDMLKAGFLIRRVLADAERNGSSKARASAYWNAAFVTEARGDMRTARLYADRALALFQEMDDEAAIAQLRLLQGWLMVRDADADPDRTAELLTDVVEELQRSTGPVKAAYAQTELARCHLNAGRPARAIAVATSALRELGSDHAIEAARARAVLGQARFTQGDHSTAIADMTRAAEDLERCGCTRQAAQAWGELADAMAAIGLTDQALAARRTLHSRWFTDAR